MSLIILEQNWQKEVLAILRPLASTTLGLYGPLVLPVIYMNAGIRIQGGKCYDLLSHLCKTEGTLPRPPATGGHSEAVRSLKQTAATLPDAVCGRLPFGFLSFQDCDQYVFIVYKCRVYSTLFQPPR